MDERSKIVQTQMSPQRLINLCDGIYAISVTLLAFNLKVPDIPSAEVHQLLPVQMKAMIPHFFTYLITFILLAVFWTIHHRILDMVVHVDSPFIWINIGYLSIISFIPFPSLLIGQYPGEKLSVVLYLSCGIAVACLNLSMLWYASSNGRLISQGVPRTQVNYYLRRAIVSIIIMLAVLLIALCDVHGAQYFLFILIPVNWTVRSLYHYSVQHNLAHQKTP